MTKKLTEFLHLDRLPPDVRRTLDGFWFWWWVLAIAVAGLAIWAFVNTKQIAAAQAAQARDEAVKAAQVQASAQAAYASCMASRPQLRKVSTFLRGVNDGFAVLAHNSAAIVNATQTIDPQYPVRVANLARLERAAEKVSAIKSLPVPTVADCKARRQSILQG